MTEPHVAHPVEGQFYCLVPRVDPQHAPLTAGAARPLAVELAVDAPLPAEGPDRIRIPHHLQSVPDLCALT